MGLGIGNCCCGGDDPLPDPCECCEPSSISIWMKFNEVEYSFLNCTACDIGAFEVELMPEECLDIDAAGEWIFGFDIEHCPGDPFQDSTSTDCNNTTGNLSEGPFNTDSTCFVRCYSASFSGPCYICTDDGSGLASETPFSEKVEYEVRAVTYYDSIFEVCATYITIIKFISSDINEASCGSLTPWGVSMVYYYFQNGNVNEATCCGTWEEEDLALPGHCEQMCDSSTFRTKGCQASFPPPGTPGHPEYQQITFNC